MKTLLLLTSVILLLLCNTANAQSAIEKYNSESIYLQSGNKYTKNGKKYYRGFMSKNLRKEMEVSPFAMIEYQQYEQNRNWALTLSVVSLGALFLAPAIDDESVGVGLIVGALGLQVLAIPLSIRATNSLQKALWLRNRDVLK